MMSANHKLATSQSKYPRARAFMRSIWFFPAIITVIFLVLVSLKISGSSLEIYNYILGNQQGSSLLANEPRPIRSDEWLVVTQMTVAQRYNDYQSVNRHIGHGQDMTLVDDVPTKDWGTLFKPENWAFFVLPFNYAFAFKWWLFAYLLLLSCYFFILALLPQKKWLAALIAISLLFSPFVQWWYQYATLAPLYYCLFIGLIFMHLIRAESRKVRLLLTAVLAYTLAAFVFVLYPPFMIACGVVIATFALGYLLEQRKHYSWKSLGHNLLYMAGAAVVAGSIVLAFLHAHSGAVHALTHTVYPGTRVVAGGGFDVSKLFTGYLEVQLENTGHAAKYLLNQSENANFILLAPFLFIPSVYSLVRDYRRDKHIDWPLALINLILLVFIVRLLTPVLDPLFIPLLFSKVPVHRLLIGMGLINVLQIVLFIRRLGTNDYRPRHMLVALYCLVIFATQVGLGLWTHHRFPGYISYTKLGLLALVLPSVIYLILRRRYVVALVLYAAFSIFSTYQTHPLYRGSAPLTATPISQTIRKIAAKSDGRWIAEGIQFENFPQMNGADSLSGVYAYPQLDIWKNLPPKDVSIYNRYAHIVFVIDHQATGNFVTHMEKQQDDALVVVTEPCSQFLRDQKVRFILAQSPIDNSCLHLQETVAYPSQTFFIYKIL